MGNLEVKINIICNIPKRSIAIYKMYSTLTSYRTVSWGIKHIHVGKCMLDIFIVRIKMIKFQDIYLVTFYIDTEQYII